MGNKTKLLSAMALLIIAFTTIMLLLTSAIFFNSITLPIALIALTAGIVSGISFDLIFNPRSNNIRSSNENIELQNTERRQDTSYSNRISISDENTGSPVRNQ